MSRTQVKFKAKKEKTLKPFLIKSFLIFAILVSAIFFVAEKSPGIVGFSSILAEKFRPQSDNTEEISQIINRYPELTAQVAIINMNGKSSILGPQDPMVGASTTKVLTAVCLLQKVEKGELSLDKYVDSYNYRWHLKQMINQSNNDSWKVLNETIGYNNLQKCATAIGLNSFDVNENTINATDLILLLQKLDSGKLISKDNKTILYSFMTNTNNEELIPAAAAFSPTLYHKYGMLDSYIHDIAIIKKGDKTVFLAIMTKSNRTISYEKRKQFFREITESVLINNFQTHR